MGKLHKIFGEINMTWTKTIVFAIIMGIYTALMAMFAPDGNSFHDIAVTPEWWVLPAILVIVNCKKPLEAALKVFVFFLISQPLVYLIQVPFNSMGWGLFGYYPYWFKITLATFPAGFIGWYMKKDKWYSGIILSLMTVFLAYIGIGYIRSFEDSFPDHLLSAIYCIGIIPVFIFAIFKKWQPRVVTAAITIVVSVVLLFVISSAKPFEVYRYSYSTNGSEETTALEYVGEPYVSFWTGDSKGNAEIIDGQEFGYGVKLTGERNHYYKFSLTDEAGTEYNFEYFFDNAKDTVIVNLLSIDPSNQTE